MKNPTPHKVLKKFWGYDNFRALQEDIINAILAGKDTLALLPTGGGKSLCYQVPALCLPGVTIVVSPLIALMNDQVLHLDKVGVKAIALHSELPPKKLEIALDNMQSGGYKMVYVSPERLQSRGFLDRLHHTNVSMIAVDEAHCISQWGHDFRPPFREIKKLRPIIGEEVPIMALTATATPLVVEDIQENLGFRKKNVFQKSFFRPKLTYSVFYTEDKYKHLINIFNKMKGCGIVYARSRKRTYELAEILSKNNISALPYNAGMKPRERSENQASWMRGKTRVMVATNAFGMGIDKPDVRLVIHLEAPPSPEEYFQEAGRGGRDGNQAWGVMLVANGDEHTMRRKHLSSIPTVEEIQNIYDQLHRYLGIAFGGGEGKPYGFDLFDFTRKHKIHEGKAHEALKVMDREGILSMSDGFWEHSRLKINSTPKALYAESLRNEKSEKVIKTMLRMYEALHIEYRKIREADLADRSGVSLFDVKQVLKNLAGKKLLSYSASTGKPALIFHFPRVREKDLRIDRKGYTNYTETRKQRVEAMIGYMREERKCRSAILLEYFGEELESGCGRCDFCRKNKTRNREIQSEDILTYLREKGPATLAKICDDLKAGTVKALEPTIDQLLADEQIKRNLKGELHL
ncbi:MAG: RecQ family ATP-dependent DNA helicase [Cryomorphaceae bacterium]|nr:RecQ family ATP-dependent DNA helicase [Cryomorphaceae bacterium]